MHKTLWVTLFLFAVAFVQIANAESYEWIGHKHGCVVENAMYAHPLSDEAGKWSNAPRSLSVSFGPSQREDEIGPYRMILKQTKADGSWKRFIFPETYTTDFNGLISHASRYDQALVRLSANGTIEFIKTGMLDRGNKSAWFMLAAQCFPLDE